MILKEKLKARYTKTLNFFVCCLNEGVPTLNNGIKQGVIDSEKTLLIFEHSQQIHTSL